MHNSINIVHLSMIMEMCAGLLKDIWDCTTVPFHLEISANDKIIVSL